MNSSHLPIETLGFLEVKGVKVYYETAGSGFPLVFLHAGGLDLRMWDEHFKYFSSAYMVIRCDAPACGQSTAPTEPFTDAGVLQTLLNHLGIEQACLIGESLGGRIAIDLALEYPEMVKGLVLSGPGLGGYEWSRDSANEFGQRQTLGAGITRTSARAACDKKAEGYSCPGSDHCRRVGCPGYLFNLRPPDVQYPGRQADHCSGCRSFTKHGTARPVQSDNASISRRCFAIQEEA